MVQIYFYTYCYILIKKPARTILSLATVKSGLVLVLLTLIRSIHKFLKEMDPFQWRKISLFLFLVLAILN